MKREGRQHGMVRSYMILPRGLKSRVVNQIDSPTAAGIFVKVPSKPTNHSKFTGKCDRARCTACHAHPASKSRDKAKGTHKVKSLVDRRLGLKFGGSSATGILGLLSDRDWDDQMDEQEDYHVADEEEAMTYSVTREATHEKEGAQDLSIEQEDQHLHSSPIQEAETDMGFHDLGFITYSVTGEASHEKEGAQDLSIEQEDQHLHLSPIQEAETDMGFQDLGFIAYSVIGEASHEKDRAQDLSIEQEDQHLHSSTIQEAETDMGFHDLGFITYSVTGEASHKKEGAQDLSIEQEDQHLHSSPIQEEETDMGFHDLGFVLDLMEDIEDWCLIGDI